MRLDLRRMPMNELTQLLKDIAHELQSRSRGGHGSSGGDPDNRGGQPSSNYGRTGYGQPGPGQGQSGGYGNTSRYGGGNYPPRGGGQGGGQGGGHGGGFRRQGGGRRQDFRQQPQQRMPVEPPAPIDDRPSDRPERGNEA